MWNMFRQVLARVLGDHHASEEGAALEMKSMGSRELNDLGIGASEVPFFLKDERQTLRHRRSSPLP